MRLLPPRQDLEFQLSAPAIIAASDEHGGPGRGTRSASRPHSILACKEVWRRKKKRLHMETQAVAHATTVNHTT